MKQCPQCSASCAADCWLCQCGYEFGVITVHPEVFLAKAIESAFVRTFTRKRIRIAISMFLCFALLFVAVWAWKKAAWHLAKRRLESAGFRVDDEVPTVVVLVAKYVKLTNLDALAPSFHRLNPDRAWFENCAELADVKGLSGNDALLSINFVDCSSLQDTESIRSIRSLRFISFYGCQSLRSLDGLKSLPSLSYVIIDQCESVSEEAKAALQAVQPQLVISKRQLSD